MSPKALSRLPELLPSKLSPAQKKLYDQIAAGAKDSSGRPLKTRVNEETGGLLGPFNAFLRRFQFNWSNVRAPLSWVQMWRFWRSTYASESWSAASASWRCLAMCSPNVEAVRDEGRAAWLCRCSVGGAVTANPPCDHPAVPAAVPARLGELSECAMAKSAMSTTPSVLAAMSYGAIVDVKDKNSLYVSNLSVNVTENSLREVFRACGQLNEVIFRTYPGSLKWYAQLNFQSADGVVQASKMEGTPICGTALRCSAIDPTSMAAHEVLAREQAKEEAATKAQEETDAARQEWHKKLREHAEARKLRTVHIDGLPSNTTLQDLQRLGEQFGTVEQLRLDRDAKGAAFGLVQFKELGIARGCCLRRTFLVDDHVVVFSESKSEVNSMDIEEATVEFRHPCIDRALASSAGGEQSAQGKFWEELAEKRRQLYNTKLEMVRQNAEEILGPGIAASPPPSPPEEDDFYAWAKQAAAFAEDVLGAVHGEDEKPEEREEEPEEKGPVDLEEHPDIVPGTELAVLNDSSEEEISEDDEGDAVDVIGGAFADGPRARRQRRAALRAQRAPRRPKPPAAPPPTPAQWAAQRQSALERLQASPAQWAAARQRALDRLKAKRSSTAVLVRPGPGRGRQNAVELLEEIQVDLDGELAPEDLTEPKRARRAKGEDQMGAAGGGLDGRTRRDDPDCYDGMK
ncbi:unnamed protein product [Durusdinium trenchii]|uniref:RRM domain-containing protein n=1 Tax=Durusdinium trenchii TaxID=1381693 RepID=A0ABP0LKH4_9DINO